MPMMTRLKRRIETSEKKTKDLKRQLAEFERDAKEKLRRKERQCEEIDRMRASGKTWQQIGDAFGMSKAGIFRRWQVWKEASSTTKSSG